MTVASWYWTLIDKFASAATPNPPDAPDGPTPPGPSGNPSTGARSPVEAPGSASGAQVGADPVEDDTDAYNETIQWYPTNGGETP